MRHDNCWGDISPVWTVLGQRVEVQRNLCFATEFCLYKGSLQREFTLQGHMFCLICIEERCKYWLNSELP